MPDCPICGSSFNRAKDFFITVNERKSASVDLCSLTCTIKYIEEG